MARRWTLGTYLAVQAAAAAGSFLLPDPVDAALRLSVAAVGVGLLVVAVLVRRPRRRTGWWLVALCGCLTYATALAIVASDGARSGLEVRSLAKLLLVVVAELALAAGLAVLGWRTGEGRWDILDTWITSTAAFLLLWVFYIDPHLARSASHFATVVAVAVPASALMVFGMAVKLAFSGIASTWAGRLLLLATAAGLCTALLVVGAIGAPAVPITAAVRASWLAEAIFFGASGLAPGFTQVVGKPRPPAAMELPFGRLVLFVLLALVAPVNVALGFKQAGTPGPVVAAIVVPPLCGTIILLILVTRLALVAKVARSRAAELAERSASLAAALARQDELQGELAYRALHDPLTGLANRDALAEQIEAARERRGRTIDVPSRGQALIMIDLDGFKEVNDTLGHAAGDSVLVEVADRLRSGLPAAAVVARMGGDEFAVLLDNTTGDAARRTAEGMREALGAPYPIDGRQVELTASIGLLVIEPGARPARYSEGLRETDRAMYAAKAAGGNRVIEVAGG